MTIGGNKKLKGKSKGSRAKAVIRSWNCYDACGYTGTSQKRLKHHFNGEHSEELKTTTSAAHLTATEKGFVVCNDCSKVGKPTTEGGIRVHKCKKDEEHAAPATPSNTAETPMRVPKRRRSQRTPTPTKKPGKTLPRTASTPKVSGMPAEGTMTRSGRVVRRLISFEAQETDVPINAEEEHSEAEVEEIPAPAPAAYKADSHKSIGRWYTDTTDRFRVLNRALAENSEGPASKEACTALVNVLSSSWAATRNRVYAMHAPSEEESPAVLNQLQSQQLRVATHGAAWAALRALKVGHIRNATRARSSNGLCNLSDPDIVEILQSKYPDRYANGEINADDLNLWTHGPTPPAFTSDEIGKAIIAKRKGTGADKPGWTFDDLKAIAKTTGNYDYMIPITNAIVRGQFNHDPRVVELLTPLRGIPLAKDADHTGVRPIGIGVIFLALAKSLLNRRHMIELKDRAGSRQHAVGNPGGTDICGRFAIVAAALGMPLGWADGVNAFGTAARAKIFDALNIDGIAPVNALCYGNDSTVFFGDIKIIQTEGAVQGCALAQAAFCGAQQTAIGVTLEKQSNPAEGVDRVAHALYADDDGMSTRTIANLLLAHHQVAEELEEKLHVKRGALHVYYADMTDEEREAVISAGCIIEDGGTTFVGTPVGKDAYVQAYAMESAQKLIDLTEFAVKVASLDGDQGMQLTLHWLRHTVGPTFNHILRNVPPDLVHEAATALDKAVVSAIMRITGLGQIYSAAPESVQLEAREILSLPISEGGVGFMSQNNIAPAAYVGAWASSLSAVVGEFGHKIPCPEPDDPTPPFLMHYVQALDYLKPSIPSTLFDELQYRKLWAAPRHGMQKILTEYVIKENRQLLWSSVPTGDSLDDRAHRISALGQSTPESSAWLTANPIYKQCAMGNGAFSDALRRRLRLPLPGIDTGQRCAACASLIEPFGMHAYCCVKIEKSNRHKIVQEAAVQCMREGSAAMVRNPQVETFYPKKPEAPEEDVDNTKSQGDIGITLKNINAGGNLTIVDFTVVAPVKGTAVPYEKAGDLADQKEQSKVVQYESRYDIPKGRIIGFAIETTGPWGPAAKRLMRSVAEACGGTQDLIARRYRRYTEVISVALQVALYYSHRRFLAVCIKAPVIGG